jgi:hypothetical protein
MAGSAWKGSARKGCARKGPARPGPGWQDPAGPEVAAPLGQAASGRLVFAGPVSHLRLQGEPAMPDLYPASFARRTPPVQVQGGRVTVRSCPASLLEWPAGPGEAPAVFWLDAALPWEIEFHGGLSQLEADLRALQLRSLDILGGARDFRLSLPRPAGGAFIYIAGGARAGLILRPPGVAVRLQVHGDVSGLAFDGRPPAAAGGDLVLESPGFAASASRYEICIAGGASRLRIDQESTAKLSPTLPAH